MLLLVAAMAAQAAVHVAGLPRYRSLPVAAVEVDDYVYGGYRGGFTPSPPHAGGNPRKAVIIVWKDFDYRLVFWHEASYCPWFELPSGAAQSYQFFEGNDGWAELFNEQGRRERNSFVEIVDAGPELAQVRWTYFGVNLETGEAAYQGVEDFWAFPNGLVLRRQIYHTLMPGDHRGYAREPIELITLCPVGQRWFNVLSKDPATGESRAFIGLDLFSAGSVTVSWKRVADPAQIREVAKERKLKNLPNPLFFAVSRRTGMAWQELDDARGVALITPLRAGWPFVAIGDRSGFPHELTRLKDNSDRSTGSWGWGAETWDHWPVGWLNSQAHTIDERTLGIYPNHFAAAGLDLWAMPDEQTEDRPFWSLMGVAPPLSDEEIRRIGREWIQSRNPGDPRAVRRIRARKR